MGNQNAANNNNNGNGRKRKERRELTDAEIEFIARNSNLSGAEIHSWHKKFLDEFPSGYITEKDYITQFKQIYKTGNPKKFAMFAFKTFDKDNNGRISFDEFLLSTCFLLQDGQSRDDKAKRLELAFSIFDVNKDGKINKSEMKQVYDALYEIYNYNTDGTRKIVNDLFKKYDLDKSGDLDMQEFINALNDENLFSFFSI